MGLLRFLDRYARAWGLPFLGLSLFVFSLPVYESYESRVVLGRWSGAYAGVLLAATLFWLAAVAWTITRTRRGKIADQSGWQPGGVALLLWGAAYALDTVDSPVNAGKILELNIVGAGHPTAVILELGALISGLLAAMLFIAPRLPARWHNLGLLIASTVSLLVAGEGVARLKAVVSPATQGFPTYSSRLWERRHVELNSRGFRDVEHRRDKPPNVRRLLIIGDSYAFGDGIEDIENRVGELTARNLSDRTPEEWESVTGAIPDTHTLEHIEFLDELRDFSPDVVGLVYVFNDIDYLSAAAGGGQVTAPRGFFRKYRPFNLLFLNSYLFQELYVRIRMLGFVSSGSAADENPYLNEDLLDRHMEDIKRFVEASQAQGAVALVVPYDNNIGVGSVRTEQYEKFLESAKSHEVPICSLADAFTRHPNESLRANALDGHPSVKANELAAARATGCILRELSAGRQPGRRR